MKKENVILDTTSDSFDYWKECFVADKTSDDIDISDMTEEDYWESFNTDREVWVEEVTSDLNKKVDGVIIAFADLGFWNGRTTGARKFGSNINSIIDSCGCDYIKLYADRYNVKSNLLHHDGTHHLTYRIVPYNKINAIMERAEMGTLTLEYFNKNSKSIRGYIAEIYGWN